MTEYEFFIRWLAWQWDLTERWEAFKFEQRWKRT